MHIIVHVRSKVVPVSVGSGSQPVHWLANVGIARYDDVQGRMLGKPKGVKLEDGATLVLTKSIQESGLSDGQHVWVIF